jgi:hypothetical protein
MAKIIIVAKRDTWASIHQRLEPVLTRIGCTHLESREPEQWESRSPWIITEGLSRASVDIVRDAVARAEPTIEILNRENNHG